MRWDWVQMEWGGDRTGLAGLGRDGDGMGSRLQGAGVGWDGIGWDGIGCCGTGWGRGGWDGTEWQWDGMGWHGVGLGWNEVDIGRDWLELGWLGGCGLAWDRLAFAGFSLRSLWASGGERGWFLSFFKPLH